MIRIFLKLPIPRWHNSAEALDIAMVGKVGPSILLSRSIARQTDQPLPDPAEAKLLLGDDSLPSIKAPCLCHVRVLRNEDIYKKLF